MKRRPRSTPEGEHRPVLLEEILRIFDPQPGQVVVDCTVGWAGHAAALLERIGPTGFLIGMDFDAENLPRARERLAAVGFPFHLEHANFAGLATVLGQLERPKINLLLADLGMSSMQLDDPERGFSYKRDGLLDMRMDRSRGRTAAQLLQTISEQELARALQELADEPNAALIAAAIVKNRESLLRTRDLAHVIQQATGQLDWRLHPGPGRWDLHPAARTFQALRILVNRELGNLENLLRVAPQFMAEGARLAILSFHSGEDRLVKSALRTGHVAGIYREIAVDPGRASYSERMSNPRSRSAKLRWAIRERWIV
jgi:16S rRNA (cytosine1402-N4)-methyltransferase